MLGLRQPLLSRGSKEDHPVSFRTANAKAVYQWIVKPQTAVKQNDMFMENGFPHDIPTTVYRSKADCSEPEEMVTVSVDGSVLDRIGKIMSYLRLGSSRKILNKKKKDKDGKGKGIDYEVPSNDLSQSPLSEDMEESLRTKERASYFEEPVYGPAVPPYQPSHDWQQNNGYDAMQVAAAGYQGEWQEYLNMWSNWLILNNTYSRSLTLSHMMMAQI